MRGFIVMVGVWAALGSALAGCGTRGPAWGDRTRLENHHYFVDGRKDLRLVYRDRGPKNAPLTLVFLHGAASSKYAWKDVAEHFGDPYRVVLIDLLGHGDSSKPLNHSYTMQEQGRIIRDFIIDQDLDHVVLIGMSYGGGTALEAARLFFDNPEGPNPIGGMILVGAAAYTFPPPREFSELRAWYMPLLLEVAPTTSVVNFTVAARFHEPRRCSDENRQETARVLEDHDARQIGRRAILESMIELESRTDEMHRYRAIDCPVLVIWGEFDRVVNSVVRDKLVSGLGRTPHVVIVPDAGHAACEERPDAVVTAIRNFLSGKSVVAMRGPAGPADGNVLPVSSVAHQRGQFAGDSP